MFHCGHRTAGNNSSPANRARQNASRMPPVSAGQESKIGALANSPLLLHMTAASTILNRPASAGDSVAVRLAACGPLELPMGRCSPAQAFVSRSDVTPLPGLFFGRPNQENIIIATMTSSNSTTKLAATIAS